MDSLRVFIVPHTHWDREWYFPFEVFRKKLIDMLNFLIELLEKEPDYHTFVLDGQSVILEDYLECHPENQERIKKLVTDGRLIIGPWYSLPDEFLVSGESLIRNLLIGHKISTKFGKVMKIGYLPDTFGHISQLPQILKGFNIDHFIFTRGIGNQPQSTEYIWIGSDGTEVIATLQLFAYNNGGYLPENIENAVQRVVQEVESLKPYLVTENVLINNGGDHCWPQTNLPEIIRELSKRKIFKEAQIAHFGEYSRALSGIDKKVLPKLEGELRSSHYYPILSGVASSRMKIKLMNHKSQNLLEKWSEPFSAIGMIYGKEYPYSILLHTWKTLLQNHAHDSICGCSSDEVHEENLVRFRKVNQIGRLLKHESLSYLVSKIKTENDLPEGTIPLVVFNPLNFTRKEPVMIKTTSEKDIPAYELFDNDGNSIEIQTVDEHTFEGSYPYPSRATMREQELVFLAEDIPPVGYQTYYLVPAQKVKTKQGLKSQEPFIQNEFYEVGWDNIEHLFIRDKKTGKRFTMMCEFIDEADCGDEYNFSPLIGDQPLISPTSSLKVSIISYGPVQKVLLISGNLSLPAGLAKDRRARSSEIIVCPFNIKISLYKGVDRVDFSLSIENRARDHRLKIGFPIQINDPHIYVETPFDLFLRSIQPPSSEDWIEKPSGTQPQGRLLLLHSDEYNLAFFEQGLTEFEISRNLDRYQVTFTLMRCIGWLSRPDIIGRSVEAGPKVPTPAAQSLETLNFDFSIMVTEPERELSLFPQYALCFDIPLEGTLTDIHIGELEPVGSFLTISPRHILISAIKKAEYSDNMVIRFYNLTDSELSCVIHTLFPIKGYYITNMNEERQGEFLPIDHNYIIGPKKIGTIELVRY